MLKWRLELTNITPATVGEWVFCFWEYKMPDTVTTTLELGKPIRCPYHKPGGLCEFVDCRFRGECRQADGIFGKEEHEN